VSCREARSNASRRRFRHLFTKPLPLGNQKLSTRIPVATQYANSGGLTGGIRSRLADADDPARDGNEEELELSCHGVENLSRVPAAQSSKPSRLSFLVVQGDPERTPPLLGGLLGLQGGDLGFEGLDLFLLSFDDLEKFVVLLVNLVVQTLNRCQGHAIAVRHGDRLVIRS